jgi:hypothetical protein
MPQQAIHRSRALFIQIEALGELDFISSLSVCIRFVKSWAVGPVCMLAGELLPPARATTVPAVFPDPANGLGEVV